MTKRLFFSYDKAFVADKLVSLHVNRESDIPNWVKAVAEHYGQRSDNKIAFRVPSAFKGSLIAAVATVDPGPKYEDDQAEIATRLIRDVEGELWVDWYDWHLTIGTSIRERIW